MPLNAADAVTVQEFCNHLRQFIAEFGRSINRFEMLNETYNGGLTAIIASMDAGELSADASGVLGAHDLTKEEIISLVAHVQSALTSFNTAGHFQLWNKCHGPLRLVCNEG